MGGASLHLPPEIVHEIFQYASQFSTKFAFTLCLVSSWARDIALPNLYSVAWLKNHVEAKLFREALTRKPYSSLVVSRQSITASSDENLISRKTTFDPTGYVHALRIDASSNRTRDIFKSCPRLTHLALDPENLLWIITSTDQEREDLDVFVTRKPGNPNILSPPMIPTAVWSAIVPTPPNTVAGIVGGAFNPPANPPPLVIPLYNKITKLRIPLTNTYNADLTRFPRLTHVSVPFAYATHETHAFDEWLEHPTLEVFVVVLMKDLLSEEDSQRIEEWIKRIKARTLSVEVGLTVSSSQGLSNDWEVEVRSGKSIWSVVDK